MCRSADSTAECQDTQQTSSLAEMHILKWIIWSFSADSVRQWCALVENWGVSSVQDVSKTVGLNHVSAWGRSQSSRAHPLNYSIAQDQMCGILPLSWPNYSKTLTCTKSLEIIIWCKQTLWTRCVMAVPGVSNHGTSQPLPHVMFTMQPNGTCGCF